MRHNIRITSKRSEEAGLGVPCYGTMRQHRPSSRAELSRLQSHELRLFASFSSASSAHCRLEPSKRHDSNAIWPQNAVRQSTTFSIHWASFLTCRAKCVSHRERETCRSHSCQARNDQNHALIRHLSSFIELRHRLSQSAWLYEHRSLVKGYHIMACSN